MKLFSTTVKLIVTISLVASLGGCAKYVVHSTGTSNQTKFLYTKFGKPGIIKCDNDASGQLSNCREMEIVKE